MSTCLLYPGKMGMDMKEKKTQNTAMLHCLLSFVQSTAAPSMRCTCIYLIYSIQCLFGGDDTYSISTRRKETVMHERRLASPNL